MADGDRFGGQLAIPERLENVRLDRGQPCGGAAAHAGELGIVAMGAERERDVRPDAPHAPATSDTRGRAASEWGLGKVLGKVMGKVLGKFSGKFLGKPDDRRVPGGRRPREPGAGPGRLRAGG